MTKCALLVHRSEKDGLLERLQDEAIIHVSDLKESSLAKKYPDLVSSEEAKPRELEEVISGLSSTIGYLETYVEKKGVLEGLLGSKITLDQDEFKKLGREDPVSILKECQQLEAEERELRAREANLYTQRELLTPWENLDVPVEELRSTETVTLIPGVIPNSVLRSRVEEIEKEHVHVELIHEAAQGIYCIALYLKEAKEKAQFLLKEIEFESVDLSKFKGKPEEILCAVKEELHQIEQQREQLRSRSSRIATELKRVYVLYDYRLTLLNQKHVESSSLSTKESLYLEGWIRSSDQGRLEDITGEFETASVMVVDPEPGESPPIELRNSTPIRPFEMITELYGMPKSKELDPTPLLAPFFAIFFGLCLTDAGYGIVLAILSFILMRKLKGGKKLLQLLFLSSLATVVMGAIVGGWFGDAFERLPIDFLRSFRSSFLVFDPMKTPLTFFGLTVGLGVVQILFGFCAALYDNLRKRQFIAALFDQLVWIVLVLSAVSLLLGALKVLPSPAVGWALRAFGASALSILLFSERQGSIVSRLGFGAYNLYSVIFILGDVLSYLRLMALGMVTGGIAMAVNIIAGIVGGVPVVGVVLAVLILIGGHLFNLAINALGAFVHTLRLQYVEFFPKFFSGGGRKFTPFSRETTYTLIGS
jgi:V/A-type H+-transporting ATPase subunit I